MIAANGDRLVLTGPITIANVREEAAGGLTLLTGDRVVDLAGVTEADSSTLSMLLEWRRAAEHAGHTLRCVNMPANMSSLARLYGIEDLLPGE